MATPAQALAARLRAMQAEVRAAEQAAAANIAPGTVERARQSIGWRASPRLVDPGAQPQTFMPSAGQITISPATKAEIEALADKAIRYQQDVAAGVDGTPLTDGELLTLTQAGADVSQILGRQLTLPELQQVIRNITAGRPITPEAAAALLRTPQRRVVENLWQGEMTPAQAQALSQDLGIKMGGEENLTPNYVKENPLASIAQSVVQYTTPTRLEAMDVEAVRALYRQIAENFPPGSPQRAELEQAFANWRPNPSNPNAPIPDYAQRGIDEGRRRLDALEQMANDPAFTQENLARGAVGRSVEAIEASGQPKAARQSFAPEQPGLAAAAERFNQLPPEVRRQVATFLERDDAARAVDASMALDMQGGEVSISPNTVAQAMRGLEGNPVSDLLDELDTALANGDRDTAEAVRQLVLEQPPEVRSAAISHHRRRMALDAALRRGMQSAEPPPQAMASPGQPSLRAQGDLTPEYKSVSQPDDTTAIDEARAAWNEAAPLRDAGGERPVNVTRKRRLAAIGRRLPGSAGSELPKLDRREGMFWKGGDRSLEDRADSARLIDSNDRKVIRAYQAAETAREELDDAMAAASAPGLSTRELALATKRVEKAQQAVTAAAAPLDAIARSSSTQPRWVNRKTGEVVRSDMEWAYKDKFPDDNINSIRSKLAADGWEYEAGRKGWSDARLQKAASRQTWSDLVAGQLEGRPKAQSNLNRSSDTLSAGEQRAQAADLEDAVRDGRGMPAAPEILGEELDDLDEGARRGKLGGGRSASRRVTALQGAKTGGMFGPYNPLRLEDPDKPGNFLYADDKDAAGNVVKSAAEKLAEDVLYDDRTYRPGTKLYDSMKAELTKLYNDTYNIPGNEFAGKRWNEDSGQWEDAPSAAADAGNPAKDVRPGTSQDTGSVPQQQATWPAGTMQQTANAPPVQGTNTEGYNFKPALGFDDWEGVDDPIDLTGEQAALDRSLLASEGDGVADPFDGDSNATPVGKSRRRKPAADAGVSDNRDASATDVTDVTGSDAADTPEKKPSRRRGKKAAAKPASEELAETTGSQAGDDAATDADPVAPVTASDELDPIIAQEIEDEADQVFETTRSNYLDVGEDRDAATQYAQEARSRYVTEQRAARKGRKKPAAAQEPVTGADAGAGSADNVADNLNASATEIDLDPVSGEGIPSSGRVYDYTNPPTDGSEVGAGTARVIDNTQDAAAAADTTTPQTTAAAGTNKGRGWWPYIGVGAAVTGLAGLSRIGGGVGAGRIDIPPPPGGGGGGGRGGSGGGDFYPIPPGGNVSAASEAAAQEAAIERALERIRGSRPSSGGRSEPYQTFQNYGIWR